MEKYHEVVQDYLIKELNIDLTSTTTNNENDIPNNQISQEFPINPQQQEQQEQQKQQHPVNKDLLINEIINNNNSNNNILLESNSIKNQDFKHKVLVDDLIISFEMNSKEKEYFQKVQSRYILARDVFLNDGLTNEEKNKQIKQILNQFEFEQYEKSMFNFFGKIPPKSQVDKGSLEYLSENYSQFSLISMGYPLQFLKTSICKNNNRIPHLHTISKYDRSLSTFNILRNLIKNNDLFLTMYFNSICILNKSIYRDDESKQYYSCNFVKRNHKNNQNKLCKIIIPEPNYIDKHSVICFEGKENEMVNGRFEYSSIDLNDTLNSFKDKYKEKTNKEFYLIKNQNQKSKVSSEDSSISNSDNGEDNFKFYKEIKKWPIQSNIPSLKNILYGVIRELILMDKNYLDKFLDNLPFEIIENFLKSCKYDKTPLGYYCTKIIIDKVLNNQKLKSNIKLPRIDQIIKLANEHDNYYSFMYEKSISQDIFHLQYNQDFLINVYSNDNFDKFKFKIWPYDDQFILKSDKQLFYDNLIGKSSICKKDRFLELFNKETNGRFNKDQFNWDNTMIMGGFVSMCLTDKVKEFQETDIDIYYYSLSEQELLDRVLSFINNLKDIGDWDNYSLSKTIGGSIVLSKHFPYRHIKFHLETYVNKQHILVSSDVNSGTFGFDGENVYGLFTSMESLNYRCNFLCGSSWMLNGDIRYHSRLVKYLNRGFSMVSYDIKHLKNDDFDPHNNHSGLSLLLSCQRNNDVIQFIKSSTLPIPYGKDVNKDNFDQLIGDHILISRYQTITEEYLEMIKTHPNQYPRNRKYSSLSSNMFPFLNVQPRFDSNIQ